MQKKKFKGSRKIYAIYGCLKSTMRKYSKAASKSQIQNKRLQQDMYPSIVVWYFDREK